MSKPLEEVPVDGNNAHPTSRPSVNSAVAPEHGTNRGSAEQARAALRQKMFLAFTKWFEQSGVDFWSESNAPEFLSDIGAEIADASYRSTGERDG